jgi:hypothetical protein
MSKHKGNSFLNAKQDGNSYTMKPKGESLHLSHRDPDDPLDRGRMVYIDEIRITTVMALSATR